MTEVELGRMDLGRNQYVVSLELGIFQGRPKYIRPNSETVKIRPMAQEADSTHFRSSSSNIKFLIKVKFANDLLTAAHDSSVLRQKSVASLLESHLRRFAKLVNNDRFYMVDKINAFIKLMWGRRWSASDNNSFLKCYNHFTPFLNHSKYEANKICELVLGNSFSLSDYFN